MAPKMHSPRSLRSTVGTAAIAAFVAGALLTPSAATADIIGSYTADVTTVEAGGTVTFTFTPTYYGSNTTDGDLTYFCGITQNADTSDMSLPTSSVSLVLINENNELTTTPNSIVSGTLADTSGADWVFDGPGVGQFTPNYPYTGQLVFEFTIPSSLPAGDYMLALGCVSPGNYSVRFDPDYWNSPVLPLTVTAPGASNSTETLPATGLNDGATGGAVVATIGFVVIGIAGVLIRRRRTQGLQQAS